MGAKAESENALRDVVQRYMSAVEQDQRSDAERQLARLHVGYPHYGETSASTAPGGFDWFRYFREHGFAISDTAVVEHSGPWATVEANCTVSSGPQQQTELVVIFRLFREKDAWLISDISLRLDADVRRDDCH
jgi:hypothetical protein